MHGALFGKKLWSFLCLALFLGGCASEARVGAREPTKSAESAPAGHPQQAYGGGQPGYPGSGADFAPAQAAPQPGMAPSMDAPSEPQSFPSSAPKGGSRAQPAPPPPAPPAKAAPSGGRAQAATAESAPRTSSPAPEPKPQSRPGLGTEFGEARASRTHEVSFVRDAGRPFAVAALNYNDRRGVDALAANQAKKETNRSVSSANGAVTISIRGADGNPLEAVHVGERTFVVGSAGQRYSIVLENHTSHRFEALGTVDGLDVINGKPGTFDNRGYILMPFATLEIEGFRTSTAAVAAFRFAAVADSYAAQTGTARNVGVIGLAFFLERGDTLITENELRMRDSASPFPADPRFAQPPRR
jgi:hypothetical protein